MGLSLRLVSTFGLAAALGGCAVGEGVGQVDGPVFIRSCAKRDSVGASGAQTAYSFGQADAPVSYSMNPSFFAAEPIYDFPRVHPNNRLIIRVQSDGSRIEQADVLLINIASVRPVAEALSQDVVVRSNSNVRATLSLNQSCPMPEVSPVLEGTINFTQFGTANSGRIANDFAIGGEDRLRATFTFHLVDVRAATLGGIGNVPVDPAVGGQITGYFDFIVRQGQRAQAYP